MDDNIDGSVYGCSIAVDPARACWMALAGWPLFGDSGAENTNWGRTSGGSGFFLGGGVADRWLKPECGYRQRVAF